MEILLSIAFGVWYIISAIFYGIMVNKENKK